MHKKTNKKTNKIRTKKMHKRHTKKPGSQKKAPFYGATQEIRTLGFKKPKKKNTKKNFLKHRFTVLIRKCVPAF